MPTYLENINGIPGGTLLTGGTQPNETLYFRSTSDADKGGIFWGTTFYDDGSDSMVINRGTTLPINSHSLMFAGVTPRFEIRTGSESAGFEQLMVIRNDAVGPSTDPKRLGLLFKLSTEDGTDAEQSNKSGGLVLESNTGYSLIPKLSMVIANTALLTAFPNGNVGIGTNLSDPGYKLYVGGTLHTTGALTAPSLATTGAITAGGALTAAGLLSANAGLALTVGSDATGDMYYRNSGGQLARVGIGTTGQVLNVGSGVPAWTGALSVASLDTTGNITVSGTAYISGNMQAGGNINSGGTITAVDNITAFSDEKLKENIKPLTGSTERIKKLTGYSFDWRDTKKHSIGLIAQEVKSEFPELVLTHDDGTLSLDYGKLIAPLIQAFNEQQVIIERLMQKVNGLS